MNVKEKVKSKLAKMAKMISTAYKIFPAVESKMFSEERSPLKSTDEECIQKYAKELECQMRSTVEECIQNIQSVHEISVGSANLRTFYYQNTNNWRKMHGIPMKRRMK
jgi:hypothetical protein